MTLELEMSATSTGKLRSPFSPRLAISLNLSSGGCPIQSRTAQRRIGHPPDEIFKAIVSRGENGIYNCPAEVADISNSNVIFGPNGPIIRGGNDEGQKITQNEGAKSWYPAGFLQVTKDGHYHG